MGARLEDWDDLRVFLAVARAGSLSGAARALGVRLFKRFRNGYVLTPAGEEMRASASRIGDEVEALARKVSGQDLRLGGTVRITTIDMLALGLLPRHLAAFRLAYPGIEIEVHLTNAALNLSKREADVALRVGNDPPEGLVGRRVGRLVFATYGSIDYCSGRPDIPLDRHDWIGLDSEHAPLARRFARRFPEVRTVFRANSVAATITAAKAGIGLALLRCGLADLEPGLMRMADLPDDFTMDLWLLTHEDLRRTARIRAFTEFLAEQMAREAPLLEGKESGGKPSN